MRENALMRRQVGGHAVEAGGVHRAPTEDGDRRRRRLPVRTAYRRLEEQPGLVPGMRGRAVDRERRARDCADRKR